LDIENNKQSLTTQNIKTMKKTILTAAIALATVFGISRSAYAATFNKTEAVTTLAGVTTISQIEVRGNVQLYLTSDNQDKITVYNNYYADNAMVQQQNGVLRIASYTSEKLVVWVTVNELSKLSAFDGAQVKSFGKFSALDLAIDMHNNAFAHLDMDAYNTSITLTGHAGVNLTGSAQSSTLKYDRSSFVNLTGFTVESLTQKILPPPFRHFNHDDFASL
jgi:hypothetical protein